MKRNLLTALIFWMAVGAAASDGRIPLYKSCTISTPGSYYVTADIVVSGNNLFTINADDVTVDLNGHLLTANAGTVFYSTGHKNIRVMNGRIDGCAWGVHFQSGSGPCRIEGLSIAGASIAGVWLEGSAGTPFSCEIEDNTVSLGFGGMYGAMISYASQALIAENRFILGPFNDPNANGICLQNCTGSLIRGNVISGSPKNGLKLDASTNSTIERNTVCGGTGGAAAAILLINNSTGNTIEWNRASGNAGYGIQLAAGCDNCGLDWNSSLQNGAWGIAIAAANCVYSNNRTRGNASGGLSPGTGNTDGGGNY